MQNEIIERFKSLRSAKTGADRMFTVEETDQIVAYIAELEAEVERLTVNGIHTCHEQCQRPTCVLRRKNAALRAAGNKLAGYAGHKGDCADYDWGDHPCQCGFTDAMNEWEKACDT